MLVDGYEKLTYTRYEMFLRRWVQEKREEAKKRTKLKTRRLHGKMNGGGGEGMSELAPERM